MPLTQRQEQILRTVIELYISSARPVGSAAAVEAAHLGVSSATVRNEMAALEELGYLSHLHTSGGRVPTAAGYRYYVENLMEQRPLGHTELQTIRHQFDTPHSEAEEWLKLAATVMAHSMHNVGLATAPRAIEMRLRHLEVISIQNAIALLIVVLQDGTVLREMLQLAEVWSQEALSALADRLNLDLRGMTAGQIELKVQVYSGLDAAVAQVAAHLLRRGESEHAQVFHAGLADMIRQPEFLALRPGESLGLMNERLGFMVDFLQQGFGVERLVAGLPVGAGVRIVIGGETTIPGLQDYSFVLGRYGAEEESSGYLGIVGPTRMEYPRAVALVQYMTDIVTDVIHPY